MNWAYLQRVRRLIRLSGALHRPVRTGLALIALLTSAGAAALVDAPPGTVISPNLLARCAQPEPAALECDYRLLLPARVEALSARIGELDLEDPERFDYPQPGATSAVLFLIDTSDPNRRAAVRAGTRHIKQIIDAAAAHHFFGIATFDSDLKMVAEPGTTRGQLEKALTGIRAAGRTTELYRNALAALRFLSGIEAERKSLIILSDGLAEDRAYFHDDVVAAALAAGITIDGIGYPRSVSLSVGLQTLRRLAEETGGLFVEGNTRFELPEDYLLSPFSMSDSGGTLIADLSPAIEAGATGEVELELIWTLNGSVQRATLPVKLPEPPPPPPPPPPAPVIVVPAPQPVVAAPAVPAPTPTPVAASVEASEKPSDSNNESGEVSSKADGAAGRSNGDKADTSSETGASGENRNATGAGDEPSGSKDARRSPDGASSPTVLSGPSADSGDGSSTPAQPRPAKQATPPAPIISVLNDWLWLVVGALGITLLALIWALIVVLRPRRAQSPIGGQGRATSVAELALGEDREVYAYLEGVDDDARYPITSAAFRIGRHADNELPIHDPSISRHHAQVHRKRDGTFTISDLESMNGVFVNDDRVQSAALAEGDLIELGDVKLRFTMLAADPLGGDETVMVRTHMPSKLGTAA